MTIGDVASQRSDGKLLRRTIPRSSHGVWLPPTDRPDPVDLLEEQNSDRLPWLVPVRRARMADSPFAFYRGTARIMASDLAAGPNTGLMVQLCGDAHLSNFGVYASPERDLVFDLNDFDETLPGPFEWDVKRLAASFTIAGRHREFDRKTCRRLAEEATMAYRTTMRSLADRGWLSTWYSGISFDELIMHVETGGASKKSLRRGKRFGEKARSKGHLHAAAKLVEGVDGDYRFKSAPPLLVPFREIPTSVRPNELRAAIETSFESYRVSLADDVRLLLDRYRFVDLAIKVVGVGSVGTRCSVALFIGSTPKDLLLLQIKEATASVLEAYLPKSRYPLHGRRVVEGQRLMQTSSDIFLGWSRSVSGHDYYWRQLKDWKGSIDLEDSSPKRFFRYARLCGLTLARAHAVSGDPAAIAGYLGRGDGFDRALGEFSVRYAEQTLADHRAFAGAIEAGHLEAHLAL